MKLIEFCRATEGMDRYVQLTVSRMRFDTGGGTPLLAFPI